MTTDEALEMIKQKRSVVQPNLGNQNNINKIEGFMKQLKDYEKIVRTTLSNS
jgi:hypothetical protein